VHKFSRFQGLEKLTRMAIFLSLFMAENFFNRLRTAGSRGLSSATPSIFTQGWPAQEQMHRVTIAIPWRQKKPVISSKFFTFSLTPKPLSI